MSLTLEHYKSTISNKIFKKYWGQENHVNAGSSLYAEEFYILECLTFEVILGCQILCVNEATFYMQIYKAEV